MKLRRREPPTSQAAPPLPRASRRSGKKQTPAERVALFRERCKEKEGYNHEEHKRKEALRVAAIRARKKKCPLGRACKDTSCDLHPDRGRVRPERKLMQSRREVGIAEMKRNSKAKTRKINLLNLQVSALVNEKRKLKRRLDRVQDKTNPLPESEEDLDLTAGEAGEADSARCDSDLSASSFLLSSMSPQTKKKTLKRAASIPGFTPVKKRMRNDLNIQLRTDRIFTHDSSYLSELAEKVLKFLMQDDNSFCCPDKDKETIRYRRDTLEVLYHKFLCEEMVECSYRSFCRYVPDTIKKPKPEDWGTSLCKTCLNPELKLEGLKGSSLDSSGMTLEALLQLPSSDYPGLRKRFEGNALVTYKEWQKEVQHATVKSKTEDAMVEKKSYRSTRVVRTVIASAFVEGLLHNIVALKVHIQNVRLHNSAA